MFDQLARKAIEAALKNDWDSALDLNSQIIKEDENETGALNRLSQAYLQKGNLKKAQEASELVIQIDPLNTIANKRLTKIRTLIEKGLSPQLMQVTKHIERVFIEEPGKTKVVSLINVCEQSKLATLSAGDSVEMVPKQYKVVVTTRSEEYIGRLPDDVANRIIYLVGLGNNYATYIKSIDQDSIKIFIREVKAVNDVGGFKIG